MPTFYQAIPKAELHVHLDGTLEPELMFELARKNQLPFPYPSIEATRAAYRFNNLSEFLALYFLGAEVIRTQEDFYALSYAYLERAHSDGVIHAEMFVGPQTHTWKASVDMACILDGTIAAIQDAERSFGMTGRLIIDFNRSFVQDNTLIGQPAWQAQAQIDAPADAWKSYLEVKAYLQARPEARQYIIGFGLDYAELGFPPIWFKALFQSIVADGFKTVAHAGEEGPADYVRQAREHLLVSRVDHGNHAIDDEAVLQDLLDHQIPLTLCPLSNLALAVISDLKEQPLKAMLDRGLKVTINSDDPAYFDGYIAKNYAELSQALDLSEAEIFQIAKNSIEGSFLEPENKAAALLRLEHFYEEWEANNTERNGRPGF